MQAMLCRLFWRVEKRWGDQYPPFYSPLLRKRPFGSKLSWQRHEVP